MSPVRAGTREQQLTTLRARTHHEIQSLQRHLAVNPGLVDGSRLPRLLDLRDRLDDELGQPRTPRPKAKRTRRASGPNRVDQMLSALDVTARDVKEWAVAEGVPERVVRGRIRWSVVEAYARAHGRA